MPRRKRTRGPSLSLVLSPGCVSRQKCETTIEQPLQSPLARRGAKGEARFQLRVHLAEAGAPGPIPPGPSAPPLSDETRGDGVRGPAKMLAPRWLSERLCRPVVRIVARRRPHDEAGWANPRDMSRWLREWLHVATTVYLHHHDPCLSESFRIMQCFEEPLRTLQASSWSRAQCWFALPHRLLDEMLPAYRRQQRRDPGRLLADVAEHRCFLRIKEDAALAVVHTLTAVDEHCLPVSPDVVRVFADAGIDLRYPYCLPVCADVPWDCSSLETLLGAGTCSTVDVMHEARQLVQRLFVCRVSHPLQRMRKAPSLDNFILACASGLLDLSASEQIAVLALGQRLWSLVRESLLRRGSFRNPLLVFDELLNMQLDNLAAADCQRLARRSSPLFEPYRDIPCLRLFAAIGLQNMQLKRPEDPHQPTPACSAVDCSLLAGGLYASLSPIPAPVWKSPRHFLSLARVTRDGWGAVFEALRMLRPCPFPPLPNPVHGRHISPALARSVADVCAALEPWQRLVQISGRLGSVSEVAAFRASVRSLVSSPDNAFHQLQRFALWSDFQLFLSGHLFLSCLLDRVLQHLSSCGLAAVSRGSPPEDCGKPVEFWAALLSPLSSMDPETWCVMNAREDLSLAKFLHSAGLLPSWLLRLSVDSLRRCLRRLVCSLRLSSPMHSGTSWASAMGAMVLCVPWPFVPGWSWHG